MVELFFFPNCKLKFSDISNCNIYVHNFRNTRIRRSDQNEIFLSLLLQFQTFQHETSVNVRHHTFSSFLPIISSFLVTWPTASACHPASRLAIRASQDRTIRPADPFPFIKNQQKGCDDDESHADYLQLIRQDAGQFSGKPYLFPYEYVRKQ